MNTIYHSKSSVSKWGGKEEDYQDIHNFIDGSKITFPDIRHRFLLHHSFGIFMVEHIFGPKITNSDGRDVPVREIAERHIIEDLGFIPTPEDWARCMPLDKMAWAGGHLSLLQTKDIHIPNHIKIKYNEYKKRT